VFIETTVWYVDNSFKTTPYNTVNKGKLFVILFALLLHQDRFLMAMHPDTRSCSQFNSCTVTNLWLRKSLYRDTALMPATSFVSGDNFLTRIWHCIATRLYLTNSLPEGKKYAIPSLHRDSFEAKVPGFCPDAASSNTTSLYCRPLGAIANSRYY
jgi:hypothetical protein